jgi:hypothetical protein
MEPSGEVAIAGCGSNRVQMFDSNGLYKRQFGGDGKESDGPSKNRRLAFFLRPPPVVAPARIKCVTQNISLTKHQRECSTISLKSAPPGAATSMIAV